MRVVGDRVLPSNWFEQVKNFDISKSDFSDNEKMIASYIHPIILKQCKKDSLANILCRKLIKSIVFKIHFLKYYNDLPQELIEESFNEINNEQGIYLSKKHHSIFIEFLTFRDLMTKKDFVICDFKRENGSCDLIMKKDGIKHNIEVKFKESPDIGISRLYDYIYGYSLLPENEFLRNKTFNILIKSKSKSINDSNIDGIIDEIGKFVENKEDIYYGQNIDIYEFSKSNVFSMDIEDNLDKRSDDDDIASLINHIFIENNGHIAKLKKKSKKFKPEDNFTGCIIWDIPFHNDIDININNIKDVFKNLKLDFDLYVYVSGILQEECDFFIPKYSEG